MSRLSRTILFVLLIAACFGFGPCKSKGCDQARDPLCFGARDVTKRKS